MMTYTREQLSQRLNWLVGDEKIDILEPIEAILDFNDRTNDEPIHPDTVADWITWLWDMEKIELPGEDPVAVARAFRSYATA